MKPPPDRFDVCETCGKHGRFIHGGKVYGPEVCSQQHAQVVLVTAAQNGVYDFRMVEDLYERIAATKLPLDDDGIDPAVRTLVARWELEVKRLGIPSDPAGMHEHFNN